VRQKLFLLAGIIAFLPSCCAWVTTFDDLRYGPPAGLKERGFPENRRGPHPLFMTLCALPMQGASWTGRAIGLVPEREKREFYTVVRVVDGNTLIIKHKGKEQTVRLLNVDKGGEEARDALKMYSVAANKWGKIYLLSDRTKGLVRNPQGHLLAHVFHAVPFTSNTQDGPHEPGLYLNRKMIQSGHSPYSREAGESKRFHDALQEAEKEAKEGKRGVWAKR